MSATNHTANYELSQYIGSDEPKYLTDYNGDMSKIDTAIKGVDTKAETANTGVATNASAISALDTAVGSLQTQVATVAGVANGNTGSINTINSLLGNGQPTTEDKTIIGAINEIYADITGGGTDIDADNVDYDNTSSGLTATNVQTAIDEINGKIPQGGSVDADDVAYDNTSSGLTATNVQDAVDEVNGKFGGSQIRYNGTSQKMEYSADGGTTWANFSSAVTLAFDEVDGDTGTNVTTASYTTQQEHKCLIVEVEAYAQNASSQSTSNPANAGTVSLLVDDTPATAFFTDNRELGNFTSSTVSLHDTEYILYDVPANTVLSMAMTGATATLMTTLSYRIVSVDY